MEGGEVSLIGRMWAGAPAGVGQAYCTKSEAQSQASASVSASADDGVCTCCASSALSSGFFFFSPGIAAYLSLPVLVLQSRGHPI